MPRPSNAKERLIMAAVKLFRRHGYDGVGLTELLTEADAPKGSFYHHFPGGKEELGAAAVQRAGLLITASAASEIRKASNLMEGVTHIANAIADAFEASAFRDGCPINGVALDMVPQSELISAAVREAFLGWQHQLVKEAGLLGEENFSMDDALTLITMLEGAWIMARVQADTAPLRRVPMMFAALRGAASA